MPDDVPNGRLTLRDVYGLIEDRFERLEVKLDVQDARIRHLEDCHSRADARWGLLGTGRILLLTIISVLSLGIATYAVLQ